MKKRVTTVVFMASAMLFGILVMAPEASADATAPLPLGGCATSELPAGDDANVEAQLGFSINTGDGGFDSSVHISENGLLTFDDPLLQWINTFSLNDLSSRLGDEELIAPLFADSIRQPGIGSVTYGNDTYGGRTAFCVNWNDMAPFVPQDYLGAPDPLPTNSFQVVIVNRDDRALGDFDIIVNYETIQWDDTYCPQGFFEDEPRFAFAGETEPEQDVPQFAALAAPGECGCDFEIEIEGPCGCFFDDCQVLAAQAMAANLVEPAGPVFNPGDSEGALAGVSFPQGFSGQTINFPGSGQVFAMVDDDGLAAMSNDSLVPGRFVIEVRDGFMDTDLGSINGNVNGEDGVGIANVVVQACALQVDELQGTACVSTVTGANGNYEIVGVPVGDYEITASAPAGSELYNESILHTVPGPFGTFANQITLTGPTPVPDNVTFGPTSSWGVGTTVYWGEPLDLAINSCAGGIATWTLTVEDGPDRAGTLTDDGAGNFTTTIEPLTPSHGVAELVITVTCPDPSDDEQADFDLYIDPSGTVFESDSGLPVEGAVATLLRSDLSSGPFTVVPDGSAVMSPSNRTNPFTVSENGRFGWDVIEGYYIVEITADNCHAPDDVNNPVVRTPVLPVEPEWLGLELFIDCNNAPTIADGGAVMLEAPASAAGLIAPATSDPDEEDVLALSNDAPAELPLGQTSVIWTVTDPDGESASTTMFVDVVDSTPPEITVPQDIVVEADGPAGTAVGFDVSATDTVDPEPKVVCTAASGDTFGVGVTTVMCDAFDFTGNDASGQFTVTVQDTQPPELTVPGTITASAIDGISAIVDFIVTAEDSVDPEPKIACDAASGDEFAVGTTTVMCTAFDLAGNGADGSFDVIVTDSSDVTPPVISVPNDISVDATSETGAVVSYFVGAQDDRDGQVAVTCVPASGSEFAIGTTLVTCEASDAANNMAAAQFSVTVVDLPPVGDGIRDTIREISVALGDVTDLSDREARRAQRAVDQLVRADQDQYWESGDQLTDRRGRQAMRSLRSAVANMSRINSNSEVAALTETLTGQMRVLASTRIDQAREEGGYGYFLRIAERSLVRGDARTEQGWLSVAAWHYANAWQWAAWS